MNKNQNSVGATERGAQIDLLIDRTDSTINLCELKFSEYPFVIDKKYATELEQQVQVFKQRTKTRKAVFLTLVTASGLEQNSYATRKPSHEPLFENGKLTDA